jgi:DNA-binding transcriptional MerR regulator
MTQTQEGKFAELKIGEVARLLGTTTRTLRFYEEQGLLAPRRSDGGTRLYGEEDIERFRVILRLVELDLPLRTVARLAHIRPESRTGDESSHKVHEMLERLREEIEEKRRECDEMLEDLNEASTLVERCFGCERRPVARECLTCPVSAERGRSRLLHLIWDQDLAAD